MCDGDGDGKWTSLELQFQLSVTGAAAGAFGFDAATRLDRWIVGALMRVFVEKSVSNHTQTHSEP